MSSFNALRGLVQGHQDPIWQLDVALGGGQDADELYDVERDATGRPRPLEAPTLLQASGIGWTEAKLIDEARCLRHRIEPTSAAVMILLNRASRCTSSTRSIPSSPTAARVSWGQPRPSRHGPRTCYPNAGTPFRCAAAGCRVHPSHDRQLSMRLRILAARSSMTKGLVSTAMPGSRWPLPTAAFSA